MQSRSVCSRSNYSRGSVRSQRSRRSNVDETLFAANKENKNNNSSAMIAHAISLKELREIRAKAEKNAQPDANIIAKRDLERIKQQTRIQTKEQLLAQQKVLNEQKGQQMAAAKARKQRMVSMDRERTKLPPINNFKDTGIKTETMLTKAQDQIDEEYDDVKHMNQMMLYQKVVTIRDKQLAENQSLEQDWVNEQKRLDLMMEIERLKNVQAEQERAEKKRLARIKGSQVIVDQIKERDIERIREEELREKERLQLLQNIENQKQYEQKVAAERKERIRILMAQTAEANQAAINLKEKRRQEEKELEKKIADYQKAVILKEEEELREKKRKADEKEREIQRLRELQEKAQDRQAELDALKAQRAYEENEKQVRLKAKADFEAKMKVINELEESRKRQFADKEARLADDAQKEREAFLKILNKQREEEENERRLAEEKRQALKLHRECVQAQIANNIEMSKKNRQDYLDDGKQQLQRIEEERQKIMEIKKRKIESLNGLPIDEKYKHELYNKKVSF